jgi:hypothetical protein
VYVTGEPDTFMSQPGAVQIKGKTYKGAIYYDGKETGYTFSSLAYEAANPPVKSADASSVSPDGAQSEA